MVGIGERERETASTSSVLLMEDTECETDACASCHSLRRQSQFTASHDPVPPSPVCTRKTLFYFRRLLKNQIQIHQRHYSYSCALFYAETNRHPASSPPHRVHLLFDYWPSISVRSPVTPAALETASWKSSFSCWPAAPVAS